MSKQKRQSPKYILLTSATLKNSASSNSFESYSSPKRLEMQPEGLKLTKHASSRGLKLLLQKDMQSIKAQLNQCMVDMNYEQKRNNMLKSLIAIHKEQMKQMMEDQKRGQEVEMQTNDKMARKIEYDMEQILQKHNEEVAKINSLKEQSASARSDRVVFSNLFKKIEKEIKQHQDLYRETIIRTEIMRQSKEMKGEDGKVRLDSMDEMDVKDQNTMANIQSKAKLQINNADSKLFLTNPAERSTCFRSNVKKLSDRLQGHHLNNRKEDSDVTNLKQGIDQVETNIERMLKVVECNSFDEAVTYYSSLESDNCLLIERINEDNRRMDDVESEIQRLKGERCISEILEDRQLNKLECIPSMRKLRSHRLIKTIPTEENQPEKIITDKQIINQVINLFGMSPTGKEQVDIMSSQFLNQLEVKIDKLAAKKSSHRSDVSGYVGIPQSLESILSKMQRYDTCERILSKKQFEGEYMRELCKTKKLPRGKK